MILYSRFYFKHGIRRLEQLVKLRRSSLLSLEIPKGSIYHYLPEGQTDVGPSNDEYIYRNFNRFVMMQHVTELSSFEGNPILKPARMETTIRNYILSHRKFKRLRDIRSIESDPAAQACFNYCLIDRRYRYPKTILRPYYRWKNFVSTVFKNINEVANLSERQQFIRVKVPTTLPSLSSLNRYSGIVNPQMLKIFHNDDLKLFLELWKWIGLNRSESVFNLIDLKNLKKVNLIFTDKNHWFVINLGKLNSWRKATAEEIALHGEVDTDIDDSEFEEGEIENPELITKGAEPLQVAKFFLRGLIEFNKNRLIEPEEENLQDDKDVELDEEEEELTEAVRDSDNAEHLRTQSTRTNEDRVLDLTGKSDEKVVLDVSTGEVYEKSEVAEKKKGEIVIDLTSKDRKGYDVEKLKALEEDLDEYFQIIDLTNQKIEALATEEETEETGPVSDPSVAVATVFNPSEKFSEVAEGFAEVGLLKASDLAKFEKLANKYKEIKVNGDQTLEEFIKIEDKDLVIEEPSSPKIRGIVDQGITGSTLNDFDSQYVENVLEKDVLSSVLGIQSAGFVVTDVNRVEKEDISGASTEYSIRVTPIDGAPSTLKFTLPKVDGNGVFTVGGVSYRLAKQQGVHLPIKKTAPDTVALTSYYGKAFITRPTRKVADYGRWLCNQIRLKSLDNVEIFDAELGSDFNEGFKAPRTFTYIAKEISGFKTRIEDVTYEFYLGMGERDTFYPEVVRKRIEVDGRRLIAKGPNRFIYMDKKDDLYVSEASGDRPLGKIETILNLDRKKAPLEYTEMGIMGKEIPIGFLLGYEKGLQPLLREVGADYRLVPTGTRLNLLDNEYAIRFADQTLVLNRDQVYPTLLFAGFNRYRTVISEYNLHEFNHGDVYLNILEEMNLSVRIMTEVELRYRMFIDPITHELLVDMGEPTSFGGLLRRATQMLVDDHVPKVKDRVRGYERFAGVVYNEIVRSVRAHYNRSGRDRVPLDFKPFGVEQAILTDSSKRQVSTINPIEDLKQIESVTHSGTGGRSARTMVKNTRVYDEEDQGLISEATVDSSKVAINAYLSANPKLTSVRGLYDEFDPEVDDPSRLVSTSMMTSPFSDRDD